MRRLPLLLLVACGAPVDPLDDDGADTAGGTDPADTDGGGGGGGGDTDLPACRDVCWSWQKPPVVSRPVGGVYVVEADRCNAWGVEPGQCPGGFTCGPVETIGFGTIVYEVPWCEGDLGPHALVAEVSLGDGLPDEPLLPFELELTLDGATWPGVGEPGEAGVLVLVRTSDGLVVREDVPTTRGGRLALALPAGTWNVTFGSGTVVQDFSRWPRVGRTGVLQVVAEREAPVEVDVPAVAVPVRLTVDGDPLTSVPASMAVVDLALWSPTRGSLTVRRTSGQPLPEQVLVEPDVWDLTVTLTGPTSGASWPDGRFVRESHHEVERDDPGVFDLALRTAAVGGDVTVDGVKPVAGTADVVWEGAGGAARFRVGATAAGRYDGRVWAGATYDVVLQPSKTGWPNGGKVLRRGVAPTEVDAALTTAPIGGVVTLNGSQPQNGSRGLLYVRQDGRSAPIALDSFGAAGFSGRAWSGPADLVVRGYGERLPPFDVVARTGVQPAEDLVVNVVAESVQLALTVDGGNPGTHDRSRGTFLVAKVDPGTGLPLAPGTPDYASPASVSAGESGPLGGSLWLTRDTYALTFYATSGVGLPPDGLDLGTFTVRGPTPVTRAARTVDWTVDLRDGGRNLPAAVGGHRGQVLLGSSTLTVPASGPARVEGTTWASELFAISWLCDPATCGLDAAPYTTLFYALRAEP